MDKKAIEHGIEERQRALREALFELSLMYEKANKDTPLHKGMRMALSSAYDRIKALTQTASQIGGE